MTVIPDSIEPYVGYKALRILPDGRLQSPQQDFIWTPGQRAEAVCRFDGARHSGWVRVPGDPNAPIILQGEARALLSTAAISSPRVSTFPPNLPLEEGQTWSFEIADPRAGHSSCSCGIYVVETMGQCANYLGDKCVICKIAVWGQVTVANRGARGEFAYPQVMYVPEPLMDIAEKVSDLYEIPVEPLHDPDLKKQLADIAANVKRDKKLKRMKAEREKQEARTAFFGFSIISLAFWLITLATYVKDGWWSLLPLPLALLTTLIVFIAWIDSKRPLPGA